MSKYDFWQAVYVAAIRAGSTTDLAREKANIAAKDYDKFVSDTFKPGQF